MRQRVSIGVDLEVKSQISAGQYLPRYHAVHSHSSLPIASLSSHRFLLLLLPRDTIGCRCKHFTCYKRRHRSTCSCYPREACLDQAQRHSTLGHLIAMMPVSRTFLSSTFITAGEQSILYASASSWFLLQSRPRSISTSYVAPLPDQAP